MSASIEAWQVPASDVNVFAERSSRFCVGIPVLDEGERIRAQLRSMRDLALGADVVIADGGSTDGSLDHGFLREMGVRALLVKRGPGALGAQLRMFFAWALGEGYDGVITIDGNGKDGPEGLIRVREALEAGYGFVQGSRSVPGGVEKNTPLDRRLGVKFIHAPLVSLAAGFRYTDTTNGLRGWSAGLLTDPRVAPFRDVFQGYELHYYLSVRAPRLGYRVTEVPVRREYPAKGRTPTKIVGIGARARLLGLLLKAATGRYDP